MATIQQKLASILPHITSFMSIIGNAAIINLVEAAIDVIPNNNNVIASTFISISK